MMLTNPHTFGFEFHLRHYQVHLVVNESSCWLLSVLFSVSATDPTSSVETAVNGCILGFQFGLPR